MIDFCNIVTLLLPVGTTLLIPPAEVLAKHFLLLLILK